MENSAMKLPSLITASAPLMETASWNSPPLIFTPRLAMETSFKNEPPLISTVPPLLFPLAAALGVAGVWLTFPAVEGVTAVLAGALIGRARQAHR